MTEDGSGAGEVDPLIGAGLAKIGVEGGTEALRLFSRVLGPSADEFGEALRRWTAYRTRNFGRIVAKADTKSSGIGEVPPRIAHRLLDEGSYCDDEVMVEYLSGVLAASRTPGGGDDRGVVWSALVTSLSSMQIRAHFLLYREWAARLREEGFEQNLGTYEARVMAAMQVDLDEFVETLLSDPKGVDAESAINHVFSGLHRVGLLDNHAGGLTQELPGVVSAFESVLVVNPSTAGMELYGWAAGRAGMTPAEFLEEAPSFAEAEIPRLRGVELRQLGRATAPADTND